MNDDLISRQAMIRWVKTECNPYGKPTLEFESGKKVIEHLKQMPSAQPEQEMGRWIPVNEDNFPWSLYYKCSECLYHLDFQNMVGGRKYVKYCPHCGKKMEILSKEGDKV